jgi:hypothetical protein
MVEELRQKKNNESTTTHIPYLKIFYIYTATKVIQDRNQKKGGLIKLKV